MRLKTFIKPQVLFLVIVTAFFSSCQKSIENVTPPVEQAKAVSVKDGHLVFRNFMAFSEFQQKVESSTSEERKKIEQDLGFKSLETIYENLKVNVDVSQTQDEINSLVQGVSSYIEYSEKGLSYKNQNEGFAAIIGLDGLFEISGVLYKSIEEARIIATTKNFSLLKSINTVNDYISNANNDINIDRFVSKEAFVSYKNSVHRDAGDPYNSGTNIDYIISVRNESNNRRLYVDFKKFHEYIPTYYNNVYTGFTYRSKFELSFDHTKKGAFGIWSAYVSPAYVSDFSIYDWCACGTNVWSQIFSGTLSNNGTSQFYTNSWIGQWSLYSTYSEVQAQTWVQPQYTRPTRIISTGNGQVMYTNTYL
jgi:hypothetical protein